MGLPNGVSHEKKGNKRLLADESFFSWFGNTQPKGTIDDMQDEVAEIIKEDLWPNPLSYFNTDPDDEDFDGDEADEGVNRQMIPFTSAFYLYQLSLFGQHLV
ncbi:TESTIS-SPECIFIC Y-ENCODED PROTEIN [Salix purpurea]|uniref:TESTIS-SPECIFIC Y-ENCODED PROTEIN n=1 Tax=Salix purpurea TaxID=77065 RepID=A0A9Q0W4I3_SALPP|nr:TESTIS-SPECIFIC Y-ENCODED PROTEIN [Salix purpurea]